MHLNIENLINKYQLATPRKQGTENIQGWQSTSQALVHVIQNSQPESIVEIGTWIGASAIFMSEQTQAPILCIDTFLASNEMLWREKNVQNLVQNFDQIYNQFCINITSKKKNNQIATLPMTSSAAAELFEKEQIKVDMIYLDAGHQEREVYADLQDWWPKTKKALIGDDYSPEWPGVMKAADRFASENNIPIEIMDSKFILRH
jgi:phosphoribosylanthranilate isomerase